MSLEHQVQFEYGPLAHRDGSMRLLYLVPGKQEEPIRCLIWPNLLDEPTILPYSALSYMWGSPNEQRELIYLNDKPFHVQPNLYAALRAVNDLTERNSQVSRILWVDALCIDQSNVNERNHQVGLMGQIYGRATHVLAWLGESTDSSAAAFRWINAVEDYTAEPPSDIADAILELCRREYWTRAWIQQEIFLANSECILICGEHDARWTQFFIACAHENMAMATTQTSAGLLILGQPSDTLEELIRRGNVRLVCSDVRDRIFSLFSVASDLKDDGRKRKADYFISPDLLFMSVMGLCKPQNVESLANPLALMLQTRVVDLLKLVSSGISSRDLAYTTTKSLNGDENASIWAVTGQKYLAALQESQLIIELEPCHNTPAQVWGIIEEANEVPDFDSRDSTPLVISSMILPGDLGYGISGTDVMVVSRRSPLGSFIAGFLRHDEQGKWQDYVPANAEGTEAVKETVLNVLKTTRDVENEFAIRTPGVVYGMDPPTEAALEPGKEADVFLGVLEALRADGELCLQTCMTIFEPLFDRYFKGPFGFYAAPFDSNIEAE